MPEMTAVSIPIGDQEGYFKYSAPLKTVGVQVFASVSHKHRIWSRSKAVKYMQIHEFCRKIDPNGSKISSALAQRNENINGHEMSVKR